MKTMDNITFGGDIDTPIDADLPFSNMATNFPGGEDEDIWIPPKHSASAPSLLGSPTPVHDRYLAASGRTFALMQWYAFK